jgi:hypothetical protein
MSIDEINEVLSKRGLLAPKGKGKAAGLNQSRINGLASVVGQFELTLNWVANFVRACAPSWRETVAAAVLGKVLSEYLAAPTMPANGVPVPPGALQWLRTIMKPICHAPSASCRAVLRRAQSRAVLRRAQSRAVMRRAQRRAVMRRAQSRAEIR